MWIRRKWWKRCQWSIIKYKPQYELSLQIWQALSISLWLKRSLKTCGASGLTHMRMGNTWNALSKQFCCHTLTWFWFAGYHNIIGGWKGGALTEDPWCALCHWGLISFTFLFLLIHANTLEPYFFYFPIKDVTGLFHFLWGHLWWSCWQKTSIWHFLILYLYCIPGWFRNPGRIRNTRRVLRVENQSHWTCIYVFALSYVNIYIFIFADKMTNPLQRSS